jgi:hypothetical protein
MPLQRAHHGSPAAAQRLRELAGRRPLSAVAGAHRTRGPVGVLQRPQRAGHGQPGLGCRPRGPRPLPARQHPEGRGRLCINEVAHHQPLHPSEAERHQRPPNEVPRVVTHPPHGVRPLQQRLPPDCSRRRHVPPATHPDCSGVLAHRVKHRPRLTGWRLQRLHRWPDGFEMRQCACEVDIHTVTVAGSVASMQLVRGMWGAASRPRVPSAAVRVAHTPHDTTAAR